MDQVKVYLRLLVKHHFWVLVAVASLFGLICWWMAASGLASDTKKNWGTVEGAYKGLDRVGGGQKPANAKFAAGVGEKNDGLKQTVLDEWRERYDAQQSLFAWPAVVSEDVAKYKPDDQISGEVRTNYKTLVFPEALHTVFRAADYLRPKAAPQPDEAGDGHGKEGEAAKADDDAAPPPVDEMEGLVVWDKAQRELLVQRYDLGHQIGVPSSLNMRFAQEDVWMLENLAKVVRETNQGAQDVGAVPIKRIDTLDVAQWAIDDAVREAAKVSGLEKSTEGGGGSGMGMTSSGAAGPGGGASPPLKRPLTNGKSSSTTNCSTAAISTIKGSR